MFTTGYSVTWGMFSPSSAFGSKYFHLSFVFFPSSIFLCNLSLFIQESSLIYFLIIRAGKDFLILPSMKIAAKLHTKYHGFSAE